MGRNTRGNGSPVTFFLMTVVVDGLSQVGVRTAAARRYMYMCVCMSMSLYKEHTGTYTLAR